MSKITIILSYLQQRAKRVLLLLLLINMINMQAYAALVIWPTNLIMQGKENSVLVRLENRGNDPIVMQMRIYSWSQVNGQDKLTEQQNVIGSPPMMTIAAGNQQIIRVINKTPASADQELTYRLVLDEIPVKNKDQQGVSFQMRYSIPLFIYGANLKANSIPDNIQKQLTWRLITEKGQKWLEFHNRSHLHIRLTNINLYQKGSSALSAYVLPNSSIRLAIDKQLTEPSKLTATINGEKEYSINKQLN